jgi:hypothetical protein
MHGDPDEHSHVDGDADRDGDADGDGDGDTRAAHGDGDRDRDRRSNRHTDRAGHRVANPERDGYTNSDPSGADRDADDYVYGSATDL